jgi:hypothetical protein
MIDHIRHPPCTTLAGSSKIRSYLSKHATISSKLSVTSHIAVFYSGMSHAVDTIHELSKRPAAVHTRKSHEMISSSSPSPLFMIKQAALQLYFLPFANQLFHDNNNTSVLVNPYVYNSPCTCLLIINMHGNCRSL